METNKNLAFFLQVLAEHIVHHLHKSEDIQFVNETLEMTNDFLSGKKVDPDMLYNRLENIDEEDILTYFELDTVSPSEVWSCIANAVAYLCLLNYEVSGEKYLPETIEAVDEETLNTFFDSYKKCLQSFDDLASVRKSLAQDNRIDLEEFEVKQKYQFLFS